MTKNILEHWLHRETIYCQLQQEIEIILDFCYFNETELFYETVVSNIAVLYLIRRKRNCAKSREMIERMALVEKVCQELNKIWESLRKNKIEWESLRRCDKDLICQKLISMREYEKSMESVRKFEKL